MRLLLIESRPYGSEEAFVLTRYFNLDTIETVNDPILGEKGISIYMTSGALFETTWTMNDLVKYAARV